MGFSVATFNVKDLFDDQQPHVIGGLDAQQFGEAERVAAQRVYHAKLDVIARTIRRLDADVVALQEVKNARVLDDLRARLALPGRAPLGGYGTPVVGTPDGRGIACAVLSRLPVVAQREHAAAALPFPVFVEGDPQPFAGRLTTKRAVVEATVELPDRSTATMLVVHFKSKLLSMQTRPDGSIVVPMDQRIIAEAAVRALVIRLAEALFVRSIVEARLDANPREQLIVAGDFNDDADSVALGTVAGDISIATRAELDAALTGATHGTLVERVLHACARGIPAEARYTTVFRGERRQLDHILVSSALWERFCSARVLHEDLRDAFAADGPLGEGALESDHAPLRAEFR